MTNVENETFSREESPVAPRLKTPDRLLLVDFDHTLFAANSTEMFISECRPAMVVSVIDFAVRQCIPWKLTGVPKWFRLRDYICVLTILICTPWNVWRWRRRAPGLFAQRRSDVVAEMLEDVDPSGMTIVSFGMRFVIQALLRDGPYADVRVVATPLWAPASWFRSGKAQIVAAELGPDVAAQAVLITDSEDDRDLLDICARGVMIEPQGAPQLARERLYLPFRYSSEVKFTRSFVLDQWLFVDTAIYILASAHGLVGLARMALIAPLMSASYMCIYELGYFENDMVAAGKEARPVLSGKEAAYRAYPIKVQSWIWASLLGAAGLGLAVWFGMLDVAGALGAGLLWAGLLLLSRVVFHVYNRLSTSLRFYAYPLLQVLKYCSMLLIFPPIFPGMLLVFSQVVTMWSNYMIYRLGGQFLKQPKETVRLILFAIGVGVVWLCGPLAGARAAVAPSAFLSADAAVAFGAILCWSLLRLAKQAVMRQVKKKI